MPEKQISLCRSSLTLRKGKDFQLGWVGVCVEMGGLSIVACNF